MTVRLCWHLFTFESVSLRIYFKNFLTSFIDFNNVFWFLSNLKKKCYYLGESQNLVHMFVKFLVFQLRQNIPSSVMKSVHNKFNLKFLPYQLLIIIFTNINIYFLTTINPLKFAYLRNNTIKQALFKSFKIVISFLFIAFFERMLLNSW